MAGEFQEATRLSDYADEEPRKATSIVNRWRTVRMTLKRLHITKRPTTAKKEQTHAHPGKN